MEKSLGPTYRPTSDATMIYRDKSGLDYVPSLGSADCGNLAAITANSTFLFSQTVYVALQPAARVYTPQNRIALSVEIELANPLWNVSI